MSVRRSLEDEDSRDSTSSNSPRPSGGSPRPSKLDHSSCVYTSCYCEENVWQLCKQMKKKQNDEDLDDCFVVFISNKKKKVPLYMQKSGKDPLTPVIWDYHVILIQTPENEKPLVYDLDSLLAFPCRLDTYIKQAIQGEYAMKKEYYRNFRIVEAETFLANFASDRSHMKLPNGKYRKPPPDYPAIRTAEEEMNLKEFTDMSPNNTTHGRRVDLKGLLERFKLSPETVWCRE